MTQTADETQNSARDDGQQRPSPFLSWLQLVRIPTVFTAMADIFLGFLLIHVAFEPLDEFFPLVGISICLYWAGMILNDYFDREVDAKQRSTRPIPSGRIAPSTALGAAIVFNGIGLGVAYSIGTNTLLIAGSLTACVWLYDGVMKKTVFAPVFMGGCRFFNVMLGASTSPTGELWCWPQVMIATGLGIYIAGLTWFARTEATTSEKRQLWAATAVINGGIAILLFSVVRLPQKANLEYALIAMGVATVTVQRRLARAINNPSPALVQGAIKVMLLSLVMLDAIVVYYVTGNTTYGLATAALIVPAMFLGRFIPMT